MTESIQFNFDPIFFVNQTYHEISTVGVTYISNRSKNGLMQLRRMPSIQLSFAEDR